MQSLSPFCAQLLFLGCLCSKLGAIGPVSPLLAGHSCDEAGQPNSVGFHEETERREAGLTHTQSGGWLGMRDAEHRASAQSNQKDFLGKIKQKTQTNKQTKKHTKDFSEKQDPNS